MKPFEYLCGGPNLNDYDCIICYGSLNFIKSVQRRPWIPGTWYRHSTFLCSTYYSYLGQYLLNHDYSMMPVREIVRRRDELYRQYGVDECVYIRPDRGDKPFIGQVIHKSQFDNDLSEIIKDFGDDNNTLCVISTPKRIESEWRIFITNSGALTWSQYKRDNALVVNANAPQEAISLANEIASIWQPFPIYVIDVCYSGGEYKLLEVNSASTSGIYACNPSIIVDAMIRAAKSEWIENQ